MKRRVGHNHVFIVDVTGAYAQINIQGDSFEIQFFSMCYHSLLGPKSRSLIQKITSENMSNEAYPFRTAREIDIGFARALCTRITYVGELGNFLSTHIEFLFIS